MRIVQVTPYFSPVFGGEVNVCYNLSMRLAERGHEVTILTTDHRFDEEYANQLKDVEVVVFKTKARQGLITYTPSIKRWMRENAASKDLFHMHAFRTYQNIAVARHLIKIDVPYVVQAHGSLPILSGKGLSKQLFDGIWGNMILRSATRNIALNELERIQYVGLGLDTNVIDIIPNGIDLGRYQPLPERGALRKELGLDERTKVVLFLGRFNAIKGISLLLEAFALLVKRVDDVRLLMIGPDDGYLEQARRTVKDLGLDGNVIIMDYISERRRVISAYVDSDLFVLPSVYDMFPTTILEAWACGRPVIVSEECGISSMVDGAGLVVKRKAVEFCDAMEKVLSDESLARTMGAEGMRMVGERFSWEAVANDFERIYREILSPEFDGRSLDKKREVR